jgi:hypothetical protein
MRVWTGLIWLKIHSIGWFSWTWQWTLGFSTIPVISWSAYQERLYTVGCSTQNFVNYLILFWTYWTSRFRISSISMVIQIWDRSKLNDAISVNDDYDDDACSVFDGDCESYQITLSCVTHALTGIPGDRCPLISRAQSSVSVLGFRRPGSPLATQTIYKHH